MNTNSRDDFTGQPPGRWEQFFAGLGLFFVSEALFSVLLHWDQEEVTPTLTGDPLTMYRLLFVYGVSGILLAFHGRGALRLLRGTWHIWAFVTFASLSVLWSIAPTATIIRAAALFGTSSFGLYLSLRFTTLRLLRIVAITFAVCGALSVFFAIVFPQIGLMHGFYEGAWRGIFFHKNELGHVMAWAALAFLYLAISQRKFRKIILLGFAAALPVAVLSQSISYLLATCMLLPLQLTLQMLRRTGWLGVSLILVVLGSGALTFTFLSYSLVDFFRLLGRDAGMTGRIDLWRVVLAKAYERPVLGYGYEAFWIGERAPAAAVREILGWNMSHSHDAWLDCLLYLGFLGLTLLVLSFAITAFTIIGNLKRSNDKQSQVHAAILVSLLVMTLAESELLKQPSLQWVLYVFTAAGANQVKRNLKQEMT